MVGRKPGTPKTGGRRKGTPNRATAAKAAEIMASGLAPLDYMLSVMRDENNPRDVRLDAANKAAPYVHPKLTAVEHSGSIDQRHSLSDMTDEQLAAIASGRSAGIVTPPPRPEQLN